LPIAASSRPHIIMSDHIGPVIKKIRHFNVINNTKYTQTKPFAVKFHFVKDLYIKGKVALEHIPSEQRPADVLTKAHGPTMHNRAIELLRMSRI
jgi:hypothetical protein